MAAKVGPSTVSYGIGVQNRYSAFLEDDDGFGQQPTINLTNHHIVKSNAVLDNKKSSKSGSASLKSVAKQTGNNKQDAQQKSTQVGASNKQGNSKGEINQKRHQQQQQQRDGPASNEGQLSRQANHTKPMNLHHEAAKFPRNYTNGQTNYHNNTNKENQYENQAGNLRFNRGTRDANSGNPGRYRQSNRDEEKHAHNGQQDGPMGASNEDEKRRRQLKRVTDMRHKDPEKREQRRTQASKSTNGDQSQQNAGGQVDSEKPSGVDSSTGRPRVPRVRRESDKFDAAVRGGFRNGRGRARRSQDGDEGPAPAAGENRTQDGQQGQDRRRFDGERMQRQRNGFGRGSGSRPTGERVPRADAAAKTFERQKPIPNFSDKSDFPSLNNL